MKTGWIISGWSANDSLKLGKRFLPGDIITPSSFMLIIAKMIQRAADFLEMSVQFRASGMTCMIRSASGLTINLQGKYPESWSQLLREKDVPFPRFLCMFPEDFRKSIWFMYQAGRHSVTSGPLCLHLSIMCPRWDYASLGSIFVQAGFLWAAQPVMSFMCITVHYSP